MPRNAIRGTLLAFSVMGVVGCGVSPENSAQVADIVGPTINRKLVRNITLEPKFEETLVGYGLNKGQFCLQEVKTLDPSGAETTELFYHTQACPRYVIPGSPRVKFRATKLQAAGEDLKVGAQWLVMDGVFIARLDDKTNTVSDLCFGPFASVCDLPIDEVGKIAIPRVRRIAAPSSAAGEASYRPMHPLHQASVVRLFQAPVNEEYLRFAGIADEQIAAVAAHPIRSWAEATQVLNGSTLARLSDFNHEVGYVQRFEADAQRRAQEVRASEERARRRKDDVTKMVMTLGNEKSVEFLVATCGVFANHAEQLVSGRPYASYEEMRRYLYQFVFLGLTDHAILSDLSDCAEKIVP